MPGSYGLWCDPAEPGISLPKATPRQLKETDKKNRCLTYLNFCLDFGGNLILQVGRDDYGEMNRCV